MDDAIGDSRMIQGFGHMRIVNLGYYVYSHAHPRPHRLVVGSTPGAVMCFVLHREIAVLHLSGALAPLPI